MGVVGFKVTKEKARRVASRQKASELTMDSPSGAIQPPPAIKSALKGFKDFGRRILRLTSEDAEAMARRLLADPVIYDAIERQSSANPAPLVPPERIAAIMLGFTKKNRSPSVLAESDTAAPFEEILNALGDSVRITDIERVRKIVVDVQ